jgi:hypothetical protein
MVDGVDEVAHAACAVAGGGSEKTLAIGGSFTAVRKFARGGQRHAAPAAGAVAAVILVILLEADPQCRQGCCCFGQMAAPDMVGIGRKGNGAEDGDNRNAYQEFDQRKAG